MAAKKTAKKTSKKATGKGPKTPDMTALVDLTPEAVQALRRPREKFEEQVEPIFAVYAAHEAKLGALAVGVDEARARLSRFTELASDEAEAREALAAAEKKLEMVLETRALQASAVWGVMLDVYGRAAQAAKKDAEVAAAIKPFVRFMATGPRSK